MRAAVFIDGGYFLKQIPQNKIGERYAQLADALLKPLRATVHVDLLRVYFYYCAPWMSHEPNDDELRRMRVHEKFVAEIEAAPRWQFRAGKLEKRWEGDKEVYAQKRVDVLLSVDLVRHAAAGHIQHAVLVAGDSDFIPAVAAAKESGVTLTLWSRNDKTVHRDLLDMADEVHFFANKKLMSKKEGAGEPGKTKNSRKKKTSTATKSAKPRLRESKRKKR